MTSDVISRFNRDTWWLVAGVLGIVIFAALMVAVQERQPKAVAKSSSSNGKMTPGPGSEGCGVMQHFKGSGEFSCEAPKGAISLS